MELIEAKEAGQMGMLLDKEAPPDKIINDEKLTLEACVEFLLTNAETYEGAHEVVQMVLGVSELGDRDLFKLQIKLLEILSKDPYNPHLETIVAKIADSTEKVITGQVQETRKEKRKLEKRNLEKRHAKQMAISDKAQAELKEKQQSCRDLNSWTVIDYVSGGVTGAFYGFLGTLINGPFGLASGFVGYLNGGQFSHAINKLKEIYRNELASKVQIDRPNDGKSISIKFAPSTTSYNWICNLIPKTQPWKDSETTGAFKILIGEQVHQGIFYKQKNEWLTVQEKCNLTSALAGALVRAEITGAQCADLLDLLTKPLEVPCERYEGETKMIPIQLIDRKDEVFRDLREKTLPRIFMNNLENTLLVERQFSNEFLDKVFNTPACHENALERESNKPELSNHEAILKIGMKLGFAGQEQQIEKLVEVLMPLSAKNGVKPTKGILLYGLPGMGKSYIAKNLKDIIPDAKNHVINGPELNSKDHGQTAKNIREKFEIVKTEKSTFHIFIFDELDAMARKRNSNESDHPENEAIAQLLTLMDGVDPPPSNMLIVGTTNKKEDIDERLLRPGRIETHIEVHSPNAAGRKQILGILLKKLSDKGANVAVDVDHWGDKLTDYSPADLVKFVDDAHRMADMGNYIWDGENYYRKPETTLWINEQNFEAAYRDFRK